MNKESVRNDLLRLAREKRGWTQKQLAKKLRVGERTVRSWESGEHSISLQLRHRLCDLFGMTAAELGLAEDEIGQQLPEEAQATGVTEEEAQIPSMIVEQDPKRQRMLKRVRSFWISGYLDHSLSLHQGIFIHLRMQQCPTAVVNPWSTIAQESNLPSRSLASETSILDVYDEADGELLILGEPGAGKTTLLLTLAQSLLARADQDPAHPMPVIFNLASWAEKRATLPLWFVDELQKKYRVPRSLATSWVEAHQILPLLDGLDEVAEDCRAKLLQVINRYRREHGFVSLVICSRSSDYLALSSRVEFHTAIAIEPLNWEEIESYIAKAGESLEGVKIALKSDPGLREMASTPLMLSIIVTTFQNTSIDPILLTKDTEQRRKLIFEKYTEYVLTRRGVTRPYSLSQTRRWLAWLAQYLKQHSQTEFYLERMQPDMLLSGKERQRFHRIIVQLVCCIEAFILAATLAWIRGGRTTPTYAGLSSGLFGMFGSGQETHVLEWMSPGLGLSGLSEGGLVSLVFAIVAVLVGTMIDRSAQLGALEQRNVRQALFKGIRNGSICASFVGLFCLLFFGGRSGFLSGLANGLSFGLLTGLIVGTLSGVTAGMREEKKVQTRFLEGILPGLCALIGFSCVQGMLHIIDGLAYGCVVAVFFYAAYSFGKANEHIRISSEIQPAEMVAWSWQSVRKHLLRDVKRCTLIGLITFFSVTICFGIISAIARGLGYGIALGLVFGPIIGMSVGTAAILSAVLNSGLTNELLQKEEMIHPNEGIRRSARNALLAAVIFGPVGGIICGIVCGISFGLLGRLAGWPVLAVGFALAFGILFSFYFLMVRGMIACLEHVCLRYYLWRRGSLPLNYVRFLNYATERILLRKIGGGYLFVHHLLLDYFAGHVSQDEERKQNDSQSR